MTTMPDTPGASAPVRRFQYLDTPELVDDAAARMVSLVGDLLAGQDAVHLCLSGGSTATQVYARFAELGSESGLDAGRLHIWWSDDLFVPTIDAQRNAVQSLSVLARRLHLNTAQTHPMPASDGKADPSESAYAYAQEIGDTVFDLTVLGVGSDGHVGSIFPHHPSSEPTSLVAIGVQDAPKPPAERISLTIDTLNRSRNVWFVTAGGEKAAAVAGAAADDVDLPASRVHGTEGTVWFVDAAAAAGLPRHHCEL